MSQRKRAKKEPAVSKRKKSNDGSSQSQSQASKSNDLSSLTKKEKEQKIKDIVRYLLFSSNAKRPITVKELKEAMVPFEHVTDAIVEEANKKLQAVFGMEVVVLPEVKEAQVPQNLVEPLVYPTGASTRSYLVLNNLPLSQVAAVNSQNDDETKELAQSGLLMSVLSMIYVRNMEATQEQVDAFLKDLNVHEKRKHDACDDDGKTMIGKFVAQRYLKRISQKSVSDNKVTVYRWGARARAEIKEPQVVSFLASLFDKDEVEWNNQITQNHALNDSQLA